MKLTIKDGRDKFYTFDTNRILLLTEDDTGVEWVHLDTEDSSVSGVSEKAWRVPVLVDTTTGSKYIELPQEFLEGDFTRLTAYFYCLDENGNFTYKKQIFKV